MIKKIKDKKTNDVKKPHDTGFLGLLVLFIGFSSYAIVSFSTSTGQQVKYQYSSVIGSDEQAFAEATLPASEQLFTDVDSNHKNYEAIKVLHNLGVVGGYGDDSFKPDKIINRAEMLAMLTNAVDSDFSIGVYKDCFTDVKGEWFSVFVCYAKEAGWVSGYSDGKFKPNDPATKSETLVALLRAFNYKICSEVVDNPYQDISVDNWLAPYACTAKKDSLFLDVDSFFPDYELTRGDLVQLLYNVMIKMGRV